MNYKLLLQSQHGLVKQKLRMEMDGIVLNSKKKVRTANTIGATTQTNPPGIVTHAYPDDMNANTTNDPITMNLVPRKF